MKTKYLAVAATVAALALLVTLLLYPGRIAHGDTETIVVPTRPVPVLTHAQEIWRSALEWCESRGVPTAVNPEDRDGTPSKGGFQFKDGTFRAMVARYGLTATSTMDYAAQKEIVGWMILDAAITNRELKTQQFPDCISRVIGLPPRTNATTSPASRDYR